MRPWLAIGAGFYGLDVAVRVGGGATVKVWGPVVAGVDVAYEYFVKKAPEFTDSLVAVALVAGYNF